MREVADMHANMAGSHGLDRDGGMWHLASMAANAVKSGKEGGALSCFLPFTLYRFWTKVRVKGNPYRVITR